MDQKTVRTIIGLVAVAYLANLTAGIIEILPDNMPLFGNIDEGVAAVIVDQLLFNGAISKLMKQNKQ